MEAASSLTLVVLAAGMGSRYGGLKQLDPVGPRGEVILDYSVYDAMLAGFDRVVFVIREDFEQQFRETLGVRFENKLEVGYAFQRIDDLPLGAAVNTARTKPWGTGHAVLAARNMVTTPFIVINADDFYGRESFATIAAYLRESNTATNRERYCMVGYPVRNTLSDHGTVARGLCHCDEHGDLTSVIEITNIRRQGDGAAYDDPDGNTVTLDGDAPVSMNFWGFTPSFFPLLEERFTGFLRANGQSEKAEFYMPSAVDELIKNDRATTRVLNTDSQWFGVTYKEDKPIVVKALGDLASKGIYPAPLW